MLSKKTQNKVCEIEHLQVSKKNSKIIKQIFCSISKSECDNLITVDVPTCSNKKEVCLYSALEFILINCSLI